MFAGLPELGISNGEDLKETLTNCTEPLKAIDQFQVMLSIIYLIGVWNLLYSPRYFNCICVMVPLFLFNYCHLNALLTDVTR